MKVEFDDLDDATQAELISQGMGGQALEVCFCGRKEQHRKTRDCEPLDWPDLVE